MLQKILLLITTTVFLLSIAAVAQDVSVEVTDILYDENGSIIDQGAIRFTFNDGLPIDVIIFENPCEGQNTYEREEPGTIDLLICQMPGEYCYQLISKPLMSEPCTLEVFCVTLCECNLVERHGEILVRDCGKCDIKPGGPGVEPGHNSIAPNTEESMVEESYTIKIKDIEENESSLTGNGLKLNKVFPNPFSSSFNIEIEAETTTNAVVQVFDLTGKVVFSENAQFEIGMNNLKLALKQRLVNGTYLLKIQEESGQIITQKLIKQ